LRFIQPGKPSQQAFIERFNKSFREEVLDANLFYTLSEAQEAAEEWPKDYNEYRPHESLGKLPPAVLKPRILKPDPSIFKL
jgi:putative transposase